MDVKPYNKSYQVTQAVNELNDLKNQNTDLSQKGLRRNSAQQKLQTLLQNATDGIIIFAEDGTVINFNKVAQQIFGYSEKEVFNRKIPDLIPCPPNCDDNVAIYINHLKNDHSSINTPIIGKHKIGFDVLLEVSMGQMGQTTEQNATDNFALICFFNDITLNKRIERELESYKFALDQSTSVIKRDKEFRVIDINDNFCQILGKNRKEFIGKQLFETNLFGNTDSELKIQKKNNDLTKGKPWVGQSCFLNLHGKPVWFTENTTPMLDEQNTPYEYLSILIKSTNEYLLEHQSVLHKKNLNKISISQSIDNKSTETTKKNQNWLYNEDFTELSQEFEVPINDIVHYCQLSLKQLSNLPLDEQKTQELRQFLTTIETNSLQLRSSLSNFVDLSKLEAGTEDFKFERHDLYRLSLQAKEYFSAKLLKKNMNLIIPKPAHPAYAFCDKYKILQVIYNLIDNAIKFSSVNKLIEISFRHSDIILGKRESDKEKTNGIILSISDQGVGIPKKELSQIFNKFLQSQQAKKGEENTGLNLSICDEIISAHFGKIWAENNPEGGAIFRVFLPDFKAKSH